MKVELTTSGIEDCLHKNGWFQRLDFRFHNHFVFVCRDCEDIIYKKGEIPELKPNK